MGRINISCCKMSRLPGLIIKKEKILNEIKDKYGLKFKGNNIIEITYHKKNKAQMNLETGYCDSSHCCKKIHFAM